MLLDNVIVSRRLELERKNNRTLDKQDILEHSIGCDRRILYFHIQMFDSMDQHLLRQLHPLLSTGDNKIQ